MENILVHNNWDPLEEIWLGDVWPSHFYDDIEDSKVRDAFYQITEWTKEDLNNLQKKFEEYGVVVRRPYVDGDKSLYTDNQINSPSYGKLLKPPITPRDMNSVIGDTLYYTDILHNCYKPILDLYDPTKVIMANSDGMTFSGANIVKFGKDIIFDRHIIFDRNIDNKEKTFLDFEKFEKVIGEKFYKDYRITYTTNGGHCDGCFMLLKPGLLMSTNYWSEYEKFFPKWTKLALTSPTYASHTTYRPNGQKWHVPGLGSPGHVNKYLEKYCTEWIGNFTETFFEANSVMIDEKNIVCSGEHPTFFKALEKCGITPHVVPFRARTFWDGGIHCITLDIRRKSIIVDYFPERGEAGLYMVVSQYFDNNEQKFLEEYNQWKNSR